ncbi:MAG: hypothetical protein AAGB51_07795 [Planctomycetota bacterium]
MLDTLVSGPTAMFGIPAIAGTMLFLFRLGGLLLGASDMDAGAEADLTEPGSDGGDTDEAFKIFSIQTLAAFAMGAGWAGYTGMTLFEWGYGPSAVLSAGGGVLMVWLLAMGVRAIMSLQVSGNIDIHDAIGKSGEVTVALPEGGSATGRVRVVVDDRAREFDAVSANGIAVGSRTRVRVLGMGHGNTLSVEVE